MLNYGEVAGFCFATLLASFFIGVSLGENKGERAVRRESIENNAAHWEIDAKTGERRFVWGAASR